MALSLTDGPEVLAGELPGRLDRLRAARGEEHAVEVAGRELEPFRHSIGVGLVEGDRNEDIDDAFGHDRRPTRGA